MTRQESFGKKRPATQHLATVTGRRSEGSGTDLALHEQSGTGKSDGRTSLMDSAPNGAKRHESSKSCAAEFTSVRKIHFENMALQFTPSHIFQWISVVESVQ